MHSSKSRQLWFVWLLITPVLALAAADDQSSQSSSQSHLVTTAADLSSALEATASLVSPAVVEIFTTSYTVAVAPNTSNLVTTRRASGSGIIVDPDGYIVTAAHVVHGAQRLRVELPTPAIGHSILATRSRAVDAQIVGIDLETDLAVIRVGERNLPALAFGDSDELRAGQIVLAVGSPLGLRNSVSLGVVSAVARQLEPESPMIYVQTDASMHPGNSGGPLVDLRGRVVGVNSQIVAHAEDYEGAGFAIPSNIVRTVYEQIRKAGRVRRGDIGVRTQTVTPLLASGLSLARNDGVVLADVIPGTPAARAGLRPGDLVLALDGKPMENGRQFQVNLYRRFVGDLVTLAILRDDQILKVPVAITEREDPLGELAASTDPREHLVARLSILGMTLDQQIAEWLPVLRVRGRRHRRRDGRGCDRLP